MSKLKSFILVSGLLGLFGFSHGIVVNNVSSYQGSCDVTVNTNYYINGNTKTIYPLDSFRNNKLSFIRNEETSVSIWQNTPGVISPGTCNSWFRASNVAPGDRNWYVAVATDGCEITKTMRSDGNLPSLQIVYDVAYKDEVGIGNGTSNYYFFKFNGNNNVGPQESLPDQRQRIWSDVKRVGSECFNAYVKWCGDGSLDTQYGEQCDYNDASHNGWGVGGCDTSCQPITTPGNQCQNGGVNAIVASPVILTTPGLCPEGQTVGNIEGKPFLDSIIYTWSCNGLVGGNCTTVFGHQGPGNECQNGGVGGTVNTTLTETSAGLCPAGQSVSNFTQTSNGNDINYTWSCNGVGGGSCNATFNQGGGNQCQNGGTGGPQNAPVTSTTPGLCLPGQAVENFVTTPNGNTTDYTWSCNGVGGGNCNASFSPGGGGGCQNGGVTGPQPAPVSSTNSGLCLPGQTVGNFTTTPNGNITNYTWSCNGMIGGSCNASFSPGGGGTPGGGGGGGNIYGGGGPTTPGGGGGGGQTPFADTPNCEYTDPPSIQIGEYLPVWWKLKNGIWSNSCNAGSLGYFNQSTARCSFQVVNGIGESINYQTSCFGDQWSNLGLAYARDRAGAINFDGRNMVMLSPSSFGGLGEYVIRLNQVNFDVCIQRGCTPVYDNAGNQVSCTPNYEWQAGSPYRGTICEMNFAVTRPYLLQRGTNISSSVNDTLGNFHLLNGSSIIPQTVLQNITVSNYTGGQDMRFILSDFINKYEKLAVKTANLNDLNLYNLKKVPDKNVYIIDAHGGTITLSSNSTLSAPTTLIVENGNLKVVGNLNGYGMYIVPDGNIYFEPTSCDQRQTVSGLFIAKSFDTAQIINNNLNSSQWCNDGRLYIKGTLKGDLVTNLWSKRRSILSNFFNVTSLDDRKNKIFEGSSLLIDTNTNIWTNLPPGANELIDKLQIKSK